MSFPKHGKNGTVKIGATGGSVAVARLKSWSTDEKIDTVDSTVSGDTGKKHVTGLPSWTCSVDVLFDPGDSTGQEALTIGAEVTLNFYDDTPATGITYRAGTATITGIGVALDIGGVVTRKFTGEGQGALGAVQTL